MRPILSRIRSLPILLALCPILVLSVGRVEAGGGPQPTFLPIIFTAGCPTLPANNIWNTPIDKAPVDAHSDAYIQSMNGSNTTLHADFGSGLWDDAPIGIPYAVVGGSTSGKTVHFKYSDESDPGPYPIPDNPPIEGGPSSSGDRHVLIVDEWNCHLYELFAAFPQPDGSWYAGSGAVFDLRSNLLRPDGWTSADAAGLPIYPGLARYDEFSSGAIHHALRVTADITQNAYVWPARHDASTHTDQTLPPMGQRFRLKASFDISTYTPQEQIFLKAFQTYGLILADNGSNWYISGAPDEHWDNDWLHHLFGSIHGSDFEAVDVSGMQVSPDSGQAKQ